MAKKFKVLLISGHGGNPYDCGAVGNGYKEADLTRELVNLIAQNLKKYATVEVYDQDRNAFQDVKNGKFKVNTYNYALEIHFNAFNGKAHGSECYVTNKEKGISVEQAIMKRMKRYFTLRDNDSVFDGVKREDFAVIKTLKNKNISGALLEVCFIDNEKDMIVYQSSKRDIAKDIVEGIVVGFGLLKSTAPTTTPTVNIKKGDKVQPISRYSYEGVRLIESVLDNTYTVIQITGNRVVLGDGLNTAFHRDDLKKV